MLPLTSLNQSIKIAATATIIPARIESSRYVILNFIQIDVYQQYASIKSGLFGGFWPDDCSVLNTVTVFFVR